MRAICFCCVLSIAGAVRAAPNEPAIGPARPCPPEAYLPPASPASSPIALEIRVLEINATKLKALGFDFRKFGSAEPRSADVLLAGEGETPTGFALDRQGPAFAGFFDALDREGLVQQDLTLCQAVEDGRRWETVVRWRLRNPAPTKDSWRTVRLRVRPTRIGVDAVRLETGCGAQFSGAYQTQPPLVEFGTEISAHTVGLATTLVGADLDSAPKEEIRVVVLITPHCAASKDHANRESCPELLAPRNVLHRRAVATDHSDATRTR